MSVDDRDMPAPSVEDPTGARQIDADPFAAARLQALTTQEAIQQMTGADMRQHALKAFSTLGIADSLDDDEFRTSDELAEICQAEPQMMARFLYAMHARGVLTTDEHGRYGLTSLGQALRSGGAMWAALGVITSPLWQQAGDNLAATICTGHPHALNGEETPYPLLAAHPGLAGMFDTFMSSRTTGLAATLAARSFAGFRTVADLGGGDGTLLAALLTAHEHLDSILIEQADVTARTEHRLIERGLAGRVEIIAGDIFNDPCPAADLIILSSILHNWDDPTNLRLLSNARQAMLSAGPHAKLWIVEVPLPVPGIHNHGIDLDLRMMSLFAGGQERTMPQYYDLLARAGLKIIDVSPLPSDHALMIAMVN
ncbi:methyltransferase [Nonomuraea sp. NPDC048892]|uniref:methyltransferase n=1 Tax=Nonomuraea sp. NPDC048892 TaxID=3154624 RepID=UPI003400B295